MPAYAVLINFTDQGARELKLVARRVRAMQNASSEGGVKLLGWYMTMGSYDAVAIAEAPDDETMAQGLLRVGAEGMIRTTTLRAFPLEEFEEFCRALP
jgi:uncharacterized protein with GYD domain